jgi:hypothetical protein
MRVTDSTFLASTYIYGVQYRWSFEYGPARQLEGVFEAVACDMPDRIVPGDLGIRKDQFQPDQ